MLVVEDSISMLVEDVSVNTLVEEGRIRIWDWVRVGVAVCWLKETVSVCCLGRYGGVC